MCQVTDFYEYKYSRNNYYINIFIDKEWALGVKLFLVLHLSKTCLLTRTTPSLKE